MFPAHVVVFGMKTDKPSVVIYSSLDEASAAAKAHDGIVFTVTTFADSRRMLVEEEKK